MELLSQDMIDSLLSGASKKSEADSPLTDMEIDALGESVNISMGAAAKALSTMINLKVMITTPEVSIEDREEFEYKSMSPAVGVKIKYVEGLSGFNFFVMKQKDVKTIVDIMMGGMSDGDESEFSELYSSAISEIMNQMMGASSTSLATFFDMKINISTPECVIIEENVNPTDELARDSKIVVIKLRLKIGDIIDSEFINVMDVAFAKKLAANLINSKLSAGTKGQEPPEIREIRETQQAAQARPKSAAPAGNYPSAAFSDFDAPAPRGASQSNLDIIMDVPLEIIVQIGKTKRPVKEIIEFSQGSVIELEKQAGDPVDILVNGELIAKGDVVVIDDNFGVRITEILTAYKR